jgi:hypothetical protein
MHREKDLPELMAEKDSLDPSFVHAMRLLAEGRTTTTTLFIGFIMRASLVRNVGTARINHPVTSTASPSLPSCDG